VTVVRLPLVVIEGLARAIAFAGRCVGDSCADRTGALFFGALVSLIAVATTSYPVRHRPDFILAQYAIPLDLTHWRHR